MDIYLSEDVCSIVFYKHLFEIFRHSSTLEASHIMPWKIRYPWVNASVCYRKCLSAPHISTDHSGEGIVVSLLLMILKNTTFFQKCCILLIAVKRSVYYCCTYTELSSSQQIAMRFSSPPATPMRYASLRSAYLSAISPAITSMLLYISLNPPIYIYAICISINCGLSLIL